MSSYPKAAIEEAAAAIHQEQMKMLRRGYIEGITTMHDLIMEEIAYVKSSGGTLDTLKESIPAIEQLISRLKAKP